MLSDLIRYPDPNIKILDPRFGALVLGNAAIERIADRCRFTEGPVWFGDLRCLVWSDIPNDRMMKWEEETGAVSLSAGPRTMPTATPAIGRAGSSPARWMRSG